MRLTHLQVQGFRCFSSKQKIAFPESGIIPVVGVQPDGGSSGAGKTSVMQAIAYALGFSTFAAGKQQCWVPDSPSLQVELELQTEDGSERLNIRRGKKTEVHLNEAKVANGSSDANTWLTNYFGMAPDLLQTLTFRPQRKGGLFLGLGPSKKRVFLAGVLGFQRFEEFADVLTKEVSTLQKQLAIKEGVLAQMKLPPEPTEKMVEEFFSEFANLTFNVNHNDFIEFFENEKLKPLEEIRNLRLKLQLNGSIVETVKDELRSTLTKLKNQRTEELAAVQLDQTEDTESATALQTVRSRIVKLEEKLREHSDMYKKIGAESNEVRVLVSKKKMEIAIAEGKAKEMESLLAGLRESRCHTCGQEWKNQKAYDDATNSFATYTDTVLAGRSYIEKQNLLDEELGFQERMLDVSNRKINLALPELRNQELQLRKTQSEAQLEFSKKLESMRDVVRAKWESVFEKLQKEASDKSAEAMRVVNSLSMQIQALENKVRSIDMASASARREVESLRALNASIANARRARAQIEKSMAEAAREVILLTCELHEKQDLQVAARAFLGAISEEVLTEIREEANAMLAILPNVNSVGIRFTTETLTDAGSMRQEIKTVVTYGAEDDIDLESQLSGGQLTSVELAVDRAVSKVLRRRHGGQRLPSWVCLDESFDGHDVLTKEACLEFLRSDVGDSQIFIIDHASEFREAFDHVITVTASPGGSNLSIS
jgi:hypothetical protein